MTTCVLSGLSALFPASAHGDRLSNYVPHMMHVCVVVSLVIAVRQGLLYFFLEFFSGFCFCFSVLAKRLVGNSVPEMTYFVSSVTLNSNSVNQLINQLYSIIIVTISLRAPRKCYCCSSVRFAVDPKQFQTHDNDIYRA